MLPEAFKAAIDALLQGISRKEIAQRATEMSQHYRSAGASANLLLDQLDITAYLTSRLPATFASVTASLQAAALSADLMPRSLLDVGAGPGTASWAALQIWPDIEKITLIDSSASFLKLAKNLAASSEHTALQSALFHQQDFRYPLTLKDSYDMVIASYSLAELPTASIQSFLPGLWEKTERVMVLIEPGTTEGYLRILEARRLLIELGAHVVAPCSHELSCPKTLPDWCHFSVRLPRSRDHMRAKNATLPFEDEKFSYLVMAKPSVTKRAYTARIVEQVQQTKAGLNFSICTENGLQKTSTLRREKLKYQALKKKKWGDIFPDLDS